jgi:hypothetical protein
VSFAACLSRLRSEGSINPDMEATARRLFDQLRKRRGSAGQAINEAEAAGLTIDALAFQALERRRRTLLQVAKQQELTAHLTAHRNRFGDEDWTEAWDGRMDKLEGVAGNNLFSHAAGLRNVAWSEIAGFVERHGHDVLGRTRDVDGLERVGRMLWEGRYDAGPDGVEARAVADLFDKLRLRFNRAGGMIGKRAGGYLPVRHDTLKVRQTPKADWVAMMRARLDPAKMQDSETGLAFADDGHFAAVLGDVYDTLAQDGFNKMSAGAGGRPSVALRRSEARFLEWRTYDDWRAYHDSYGDGDLFDVISEHIDGMTKDIAALEVLGPNPVHTIRFMNDAVQMRAAERDAADGGDKHMKRARAVVRRARLLWEDFSGAAHAPLRSWWATGLQSIRAYLPAAQLGSALLSSVTDFNTARIAAQHAGISTVNIMRNYLKLMNPLDAADRQLARQSGLVMDGYIQRSGAMHRFFGESPGPQIAQRITHSVLTLSGLEVHTNQLRFAVGMEFAGAMARHAHLAFDALPQDLHLFLSRAGFAQDWDRIRSVTAYAQGNTRFIRPADLNALDAQLATRYAALVADLTNMAVPSTSARGRLPFLGGTQKGTFIGEFMASAFMYKSFPVTFFGVHMRRIMLERGVANKAVAAADLVISTTLFGALSVWLVDIANGRDPSDAVDNADTFWGRALLKGGGLGIFGDFLASATNRFGGSFGETIAGPAVGLIYEGVKLPVSNAALAVQGKDTKFAADAARMAQRYLPGQNLWYARLALDRLWWNRVQEWADPNIEEKRNQLERKHRKEYGADYYWAPGETAPRRAPELGNAVGADQ